jgi:F-type H+-transporting ATPase subunit delta
LSSNKSFSNETADRYARALFELAKENSEQESIEKNIQELLQLYNSCKDLETFVKNPTQSLFSQLSVINNISKLMNFSKILNNFLSVLVVKKRIFFIKKIMQNYLKLSALKRGELNAQLISSKVLSVEELKNISKELSKVIGSEINFEFKVDEDLIGGFKMQIGSLMIDTSIKNKLKQYEQTMLEN